MGQHAIDEPGGCVRHPPTAAGRAESSTLARKGNETIVSAGVAMHPQKSMRENPALEISADLSLDESGNRRALPSRASQEGLELFADDFVEKCLFGFVAFVSDSGQASVGTLRARALQSTANNVPRSSSRCDDSRATDRPRVGPASIRTLKISPYRVHRFTHSEEPCGLLGT